jgi:hypothetical protein
MPATASPSSATEAFRQLGRLLAGITLRAEERAKATHSRFNVFTTLLKENDEVRLHTRFLHALLDPEGLHDCGPRFLELFLKRIPLEEGQAAAIPSIPSAEDGWAAKKEAGRSKGFGQIDLLLEHRRFGIAIENKIHAYEQPGQLASYASFLRARYGENFLLLFLTLDGKESETHGGERYLKLSYADHILPWLDDCLRETYAIIPVNQMLLQYREVVRSLTGKTLETAMMKPVVDFVSLNPDIIRHREAWYEAVDQAKSLFLDRIAKAVIDGLPGDYKGTLHPENDEGRFGAEWGGLLIRGKGDRRLLPEPFEVYLENSTDEENLCVGVFAECEETPLSGAQQKWLNAVRAAWQLTPVGAEALDNKPTRPWPLGWIVLDTLGDERVAEMMEPGRFDDLVAGFIDRIVDFATTIERTTSAVGETTP